MLCAGQMFHFGTWDRAGDTGVSDQLKTILCVGLVLLGLALTVPWWGLLGWMALRLVRNL